MNNTNPPPTRKNNELQLKRRAQMFNYLLGWVTLVCVIGMALDDLQAYTGIPIEKATGNTFTGVFFLLIFVHAFAALYLYGVPEYKKNIRVIDIYIGFSLFVVLLANRSFIYVSPLNTITRALMYLPIVVHVLFNINFAIQRITGKIIHRPLKLYLGGNVVRDATAD
ncbi:MAG: hypothetical protein KIH69_014350 [Anaerolineae bacterium]|nr:hypothetical protein [Anaerolineae bacterium]